MTGRSDAAAGEGQAADSLAVFAGRAEGPVERALAAAKAAGAVQAEAVLVEEQSLEARLREGRREELGFAENRGLRLRLFAKSGGGLAAAAGSLSDLSNEAIERLAGQLAAAAKEAPEDIGAGLAEEALLAPPDAAASAALELADPAPAPDGAALFAAAEAGEAAGKAVAGVSMSEGVRAGYERVFTLHRASNGLSYLHEATLHGFSASMVAGRGREMQSDWDYAMARFGADLEPPEAVGRRAGERAAAKRAPKPPRSGAGDVVFEPRAAEDLLRAFAGSASGEALVRGSSFLLGREEASWLPGPLSIVDRPRLPRGLRSRAVDAEGLASTERQLFAEGRFLAPLLDLQSARRLGRDPSANAVGRGSPGAGTSNLCLLGGDGTAEALIASVKRGVFITGLMGHGYNPATGDWSRAAEGFHIENGALAGPASGFTVAGNIPDFAARIQAAGDLALRSGTDSPTLLVPELMLASD